MYDKNIITIDADTISKEENRKSNQTCGFRKISKTNFPPAVSAPVPTDKNAFFDEGCCDTLNSRC